MRARVLGLCLGLLAACEDSASPPDGPASPWSTVAEMPTPRLEPGVATLGQRLIVVGGFDQNQQQGLNITSDVISYDPFADTWSALPAAPVAWTHANVAASSATLYLLGGAEGSTFIPRGESYAIDLDQGAPTWRSLAAQPAGSERSAAGVIVSPPHIILVGGATETGALATVIQYDLSTDTWSDLPALPEALSHPAVMRRPDGTMIAAGGLTTLDARSATDHVWVLYPLAPSWVAGAPMPTARGGCAHGAVLEQLICAGGEAGEAALSVVERYDPLGNTWSQLPDLPEPRAGTQGGVIGGRLYVPGGARTLTFTPTSTMFRFNFLDAIDSDR